jgi:cysteinyl-tRNA synthetase
MAIRVFNTLSKSKEDFKPLEAGKAGIYVCGITPYDYCHIGHGRCYVAFDVIRRYLAHKGLAVKYVQNFTDIDDKIINRAKETGEDPLALSKRFSEEYFVDFDRLGVRRADEYTYVTGYLPQIIAFIGKILSNGYAYAVAGQSGFGQDVFFEVSKFKDYGRLSGQPLEKLRAGARVEINERKKNPEDFALWKSAKPGEPSWDSPWGKGRPGWHIECSVMSAANLGDTFDIHGGGQDLIFPHHEDEIAQSQAATGKPFARYWLHNGFVVVGKEKMAKSLGNFVTLRHALDKYGPRLLRLFYVSTQYREPVDSHPSRIEELRPVLQKLLDLRRMLLEEMENHARPEKSGKDEGINEKTKAIIIGFDDAMDDDFNTALAMKSLFELKDYSYKLQSDPAASRASFALLSKTYESLANGVLGIFDAQETKAELSEGEIADLVSQREDAKGKNDFAVADGIRAQLKEKGIILEDTSEGPKWKRAA